MNKRKLSLTLSVICVISLVLCWNPHVDAMRMDLLAVNKPDSIVCDTLADVDVSEELLKHNGNEDIITVTKSMRKGSKNTGELLGRISGAFYNPMTTDLMYNGSKNILILVDGVEKSPDYIKRLNPERFDKIKIVNMPTGIHAGYDAVIDLHTKPLYMGYEGVVLSEAVIASGDRNGRDRNLKKSHSAAQMTYTLEKFNVDFVTDYSFNQQGLSDYFERSYPLNGLVESTVETENNAPNKTNRNNRYVADLAIDYDINPSNSLSAKISMTPSSDHSNYNYLFKRTSDNQNITSNLNETGWTNVKGRLDVLAGFWYRGTFLGWNMNAYLTFNNIRYKWYNDVFRNTGYTNIDNREILSRYFTGGVEMKRFSSNNKLIFSLSDDFIKSDFSEERLETGNRLSESKDFRNTFSGSVQFQGSRSFSIGLNAGISVFRNSFNTDSETHVTPKAGVQLMWSVSRNLLVRMNYAMTTQYPPLSQLQDYGQFTDSLMYTYGNPYLKPALNHEFSFSATIFNNFTVEGRYNRFTNSIMDCYSAAEGEIPSGSYTYYTRQGSINATKNLWSVNLTYYNFFGRHWQIAFTGKVVGHRAEFRSLTSSKILPEYSWFVLYQIMNGSWQFYLSGGMQSYSIITPQSKQWCLDDGTALSVSKMLFKNRLQILGMWYIPFHITDGNWHGGVNSESYNVRYWADNQSRKNNQFQITILYRFSGGKSVKKYNRSGGTVEI